MCWFIKIMEDKWVEEGKCNTVAGCDLCHMWEALSYEMPSVCLYVSVCLVYMGCGIHQRMRKHCAGCGLIAY